MEMSNDIGQLALALSKAQAQMKPATFDAINPHFKNKYASLAALLEACRPALSANEISVIQAGSVQEGYVSVETMLIHSSGQWIRDTLSIKLAREDAQAVGSALTYARRYSLASMAGVICDSGEDDDAESAVGRPTNQPTPIRTKKVNAVNPVPVVKSADPSPTPNTPQSSATSQKPPMPKESNGNGSNGKKANGNGKDRIVKIREIFTLSGQLNETPDQMKTTIGQILGLEHPIKESADIPTEKLDLALDTYRSAVANMNNRKEVKAA